MDNTTNKTTKLRTLGLVPTEQDPPEIGALMAELKEYLKTIDFRNDSIYDAYYSFDYDGVTYRMAYNVLRSSPAKFWIARSYITEKLHQMGASNIQLYTRND